MTNRVTPLCPPLLLQVFVEMLAQEADGIREERAVRAQGKLGWLTAANRQLSEALIHSGSGADDLANQAIIKAAAMLFEAVRRRSLGGDDPFLVHTPVHAVRATPFHAVYGIIRAAVGAVEDRGGDVHTVGDLLDAMEAAATDSMALAWPFSGYVPQGQPAAEQLVDTAVRHAMDVWANQEGRPVNPMDDLERFTGLVTTAWRAALIVPKVPDTCSAPGGEPIA